MKVVNHIPFTHIYYYGQFSDDFNKFFGVLDDRVAVDYYIENYYVDMPLNLIGGDPGDVLGGVVIVNTGVVQYRGAAVARANPVAITARAWPGYVVINKNIALFRSFRTRKELEEQYLGIIVMQNDNMHNKTWNVLKQKKNFIYALGLESSKGPGLVKVFPQKDTIDMAVYDTIILEGEIQVDALSGIIKAMKPARPVLVSKVELAQRKNPYFELGKVVGYDVARHAVIYKATLVWRYFYDNSKG